MQMCTVLAPHGPDGRTRVGRWPCWRDSPGRRDCAMAAAMRRLKAMLMAAMVLLVSLAAMMPTALGKSVKNPADALANAINRNLTDSKLSKLYDNPGLGCIALQYIQAYQGQCSAVGATGERPDKDAFKSTFADNCGVDPSSVSEISGTVLACESAYKDADYAFSNLLFKEEGTVATLQNTNQTEFGVGISGYEGGSPYFWCVLFSNGAPNATFTFADKTAKYQKTGCFSGTGEPCSGALVARHASVSLLLFGIASFLFVSGAV